MNYVTKIVFVGDSGVGKTNIFHQYIYRKPAKTDKTTIGAEFSTIVKNIGGNDIIVQIWDTAGQERFRSINKLYYKDANSIIIIYDVTRKSTFDNIKVWLDEINSNVNDINNIDITVIGNKIDLSYREVQIEDINNFKKLYNFKYYETTIKDSNSIDLALNSIIQKIINEDKFIRPIETFNVSYDKSDEYDYPSCCSIL